MFVCYLAFPVGDGSIYFVMRGESVVHIAACNECVLMVPGTME